jgi:hypothetical protein
MAQCVRNMRSIRGSQNWTSSTASLSLQDVQLSRRGSQSHTFLDRVLLCPQPLLPGYAAASGLRARPPAYEAHSDGPSPKISPGLQGVQLPAAHRALLQNRQHMQGSWAHRAIPSAAAPRRPCKFFQEAMQVLAVALLGVSPRDFNGSCKTVN